MVSLIARLHVLGVLLPPKTCWKRRRCNSVLSNMTGIASYPTKVTSMTASICCKSTKSWWMTCPQPRLSWKTIFLWSVKATISSFLVMWLSELRSSSLSRGCFTSSLQSITAGVWPPSWRWITKYSSSGTGCALTNWLKSPSHSITWAKSLCSSGSLPILTRAYPTLSHSRQTAPLSTLLSTWSPILNYLRQIWPSSMPVLTSMPNIFTVATSSGDQGPWAIRLLRGFKMTQ